MLTIPVSETQFEYRGQRYSRHSGGDDYVRLQTNGSPSREDFPDALEINQEPLDPWVKLPRHVISGRFSQEVTGMPTKGGPKDTVGGFVARAADAQKLIDSHQIADGFGLDYGKNRTVPTKFTEPSGGTYAVRFRMTDEFDLRVPAGEAAQKAGLPLDRSGRPYFSPPDMDPLGPENPYLGTGFVGKGATEIIPEYHLPTRTELKDGTEIYRITPDGQEVLVAYKEAGDWVEL